MTKTFAINEKLIVAKPFDFNMVADLGDCGVDITKISSNGTSLIRAYVAVCSGVSVQEAGLEIQKHIVAGGNLNEVNEVMAQMMADSDFFRAINKAAEEETTKNTKKKAE